MRSLFAASVTILLLLAACGGGGQPSEGEQTFEALRDDASQTPVDDSVLAYTAQLCDPLRTFFDGAGSLLLGFEEEAADIDSFDEAFDVFSDLVEPLSEFFDDIEDIDPPGALRDFHEDIVDQLEYAREAVEAMEEGGFFAAFTLPDPPPEPESPEGFEAAILIECGDELAGFFEDFGGDIFDLDVAPGASEDTAAPAASGVLNESVSAGDFELLVHSIDDPVAGESDFFEPEPGNRWLAIEVSLTNIGSATQDYGSFDFKVKDAENFEYGQLFIDLAQSLDSGTLLAGETVRGRIGFEVPESATVVRLIFEPDFFGEGRIDVDLQ